MDFYHSKYGKLAGSSYSEVMKKARLIFRNIEKRSKRSAYVRSKYFNKQKVFLSYFWSHLEQKGPKERTRRLKYYQCALDLLCNTLFAPTTIEETGQSGIQFHRFGGKTKEGETFYVQVKENKNIQKLFMSVFPEK